MPEVKILSVVGARPQFVKAAMLSRAIARRDGVVEEGVHTGQHYDEAMSEVFFRELEIPAPVVNLEVGSGSHAQTTGLMLKGLEREMVEREPNWVLLYGDTNSTLAGALAAAKLGIPVAHVEAGLRSFNRAMPEEINRICTDHVSSLLLCPTLAAVKHLAREGITAGVHHCGDVMYDAALVFGEVAERRSDALDRFGLEPGGYALATVHRAENTDAPERLRGILDGLSAVAESGPVLLPVHPRTRKCIDEQGLGDRCAGTRLVDPVPFLDMIQLEKHARVILTDSGGVQKEAYFHRVPCVTLRDETEWTETVDAGWNRVVGADPRRIAEAASMQRPVTVIDEYGEGRAADIMLDLLLQAT